MIDWFVFLATWSIDADLFEERFHAECSRFIGKDRDDPLADSIDFEQISEKSCESHRCRSWPRFAGSTV